MNNWNPQDDAWLAGFVAGEATFIIGKSRSGRQPKFVIELRADEAAVLYRLRDAFGGTVRVRPHQKGKDARPTLAWCVEAKAALVALVAYFERFPLRAKKQADLDVWADAVRLYVEGGYRAEGLDVLAERLRAVRAYEPPEIESVVQSTRKDVAKLAGVSERTVKRVVAPDDKPVSVDAERRVREAMATLGYTGGGRQRPRLRVVA